MSKISIVIPCYNEEKNIPLIYERIVSMFKNTRYDWEIIFADNFSKDKSREIIEKLAENDIRVKAIFNAKNFGFVRSTFHALVEAQGDCVAMVFADMQDPPELVLSFLDKWEHGSKIVVGIKNKSQENKLMYFIRKMYYKFIKRISEIEHIEQFTGFGLYDKSFINVLRGLDDPLPYLRGIVAELGYKIERVYYEQERRKFGHSNFNFYYLYDVAMLGITSYSKVVLRMATMFGFAFSGICMGIALLYLIAKLIWWNSFPIGIAPMIIGIFFMGSIQLFFIGLLGEYIININTRVMKRPLVIEERRINF